MTHEQFLEEPASVVDWTLRLDDLRVDVENEWAQRSSSPA